MNPDQVKIIGQLFQKHQGALLSILKMVKENSGSDEELGKKTREVLTDVLNISVKDFL